MPLEREVKLQVGEAFELPDLDGIAGLRAADHGVHVLEAAARLVRQGGGSGRRRDKSME